MLVTELMHDEARCTCPKHLRRRVPRTRDLNDPQFLVKCRPGNVNIQFGATGPADIYSKTDATNSAGNLRFRIIC